MRLAQYAHRLRMLCRQAPINSSMLAAATLLLCTGSRSTQGPGCMSEAVLEAADAADVGAESPTAAVQMPSG